VLVLLSVLYTNRTCTRPIKQKTQQNNKQESTPDLRGSAMCLHPREMTSHHHHIDHETLQVQYKQQLA